MPTALAGPRFCLFAGGEGNCRVRQASGADAPSKTSRFPIRIAMKTSQRERSAVMPTALAGRRFCLFAGGEGNILLLIFATILALIASEVRVLTLISLA
jgi:hypothetical protein